MSLEPGTRLGTYEILGLLGVGGMGEVYRALDTNLGRDIALKTLPAAVTHDQDRLARFRREAQVLAALNHPNIASIYGLEEAGPQRFLVLELVEGETLADRIRNGPLPVTEALEIARQIAEALQAAHDKGIVHRDLKPANIALTADDAVKVLDFGLAKAIDPGISASGADPVNSPTITSPTLLTGLGVILGTAAYMSPEQAKGRQADKRSDVWAFGCVLYEMLTGKRPFKGDDVSDTLAAVLRGDPAWEALPSSVPTSVRALIEGCLQKNPRERIGDISTASFVLKQPAAPAAPTPSHRSSNVTAAALLVAGIALGAAVALLWRSAPAVPAAPVTRFTVPVPEETPLTVSRNVLAVSPDGSHLVFSAGGQLYVRSLADGESRLLSGAGLGVNPVFSPDGRSVAYWADPAIRRIAIAGGVPVTVCETVPAPFGMHWTDRGIFFVQPGKGVARVDADGGTPQIVVPLPGSEALVYGPQLLPDGNTLLFTVASIENSGASLWDKAQIVTHSLRTGERRTLVASGSDARYLPTGHLTYMVEGTLMAIPMDLKQLKVIGSPVPMVEGIRRGAAIAGSATHVGVSATGILAYVPGPARSGREDVMVFDRKGIGTGLNLPPGFYTHPRVSPDGQHLVFETRDGKNSVVSTYPLSGKRAIRRLTFEGNNRMPIWSRDGKHVVFQSDREGDHGIFWQPVAGGPAERLTRAPKGTTHIPESWSPVEDVFLYGETGASGTTLFVYSLADRRATRFSDVLSLAAPTNAVFRRDGRWIAYQIGAVGVAEAITYVEPYPANRTKHEVGRGGRALWSPDGRELFFIPAPGEFKVVTVQTEPTVEFTPPTPLVRRFGLAPPGSPRPYDVLPDGRFVGLEVVNASGESRTQQIKVVLNWFEELKARVPIPK